MNPLIGANLRAMKIFGYMIYDDQKYKRLHCFRGVLLTVSFIIFNISQFIDLFQHFTNIDEITKNAATTLLFATTSFRMINFYKNRQRYLAIIKYVDSEIKKMLSIEDNHEKEIIHSSIKYMRNLTACFWIIALITGNLMCVNAAVQAFLHTSDKSPPLILRNWFPFNNFWLSYFIQYYIMNIGMLIVPCWHSFIVSIMIFVITKLKILNKRLSGIDEEYSHFVECVKKRSDIYIFVKELTSLISSSLFMDFIVFSILLCALLFQATQVDFGIQLAIIFFYIVTMTTILWMYYNHANEITFYSNQLSISAYECNWYEHSRHFRKQILILITASKPIIIHAVFIIMKLDTFLSILRASYSYFTLLSNIANDKALK
ncbi:CLUMA_CG020270, isoform A [Clunio marinus]|uniref:Odorant receptor n=1 Tax=Clunio marinus TaxID=568069 RepID=A0A1J1J4G6_9DIPT|nr:CLUMA_CG020270, isoform A [Clunio marinus]